MTDWSYKGRTSEQLHRALETDDDRLLESGDFRLLENFGTVWGEEAKNTTSWSQETKNNTSWSSPVKS